MIPLGQEVLFVRRFWRFHFFRYECSILVSYGFHGLRLGIKLSFIIITDYLDAVLCNSYGYIMYIYVLYIVKSR